MLVLLGMPSSDLFNYIPQVLNQGIEYVVPHTGAQWRLFSYVQFCAERIYGIHQIFKKVHNPRKLGNGP